VFFALVLVSIPALSRAEEPTGNEIEEFDFANGLFSRGMYDMAVDGYNEFLARYPGSRYAEAARYRIAECYFLEKDYGKALTEFGRFLSAYPSSEMAVKARLRTGQIYYASGDLEKSAAVMSAVTADKKVAEEDRETAAYYLAGISLKRGDYDRARAAFERFLAGYGEGTYAPFVRMNLGDIYMEEKKYPAAARAYLAAGELSPDSGISMEAALRAGGAFYLAGDPVKAAEQYRRVLDNAAGGAAFDSAAVGLITAYYDTGDHAAVIKASGDLLPGIKNDGTREQILFMQGNSYLSGDRFEEAESVYNEVVSLYPDTVLGRKSRLNKCWALYKSGDHTGCLKEVGSYLEEVPGPKDEALYVKAKVLTELERIEKALEIYGELVRGHRDSAFYGEALYDTGWLYDRAGDIQSAVKSHKMFAERYPDDTRSPGTLLKAAQSELGLGRYADAESSYLKFLAAYDDDPRRENALYQLGRAYFEQGKYDKVVQAYDEFLKEFPASEAARHVFYWRGNAYQKKQSWDKAIEDYRRASAGEDELATKAAEAAAFCYLQKGDEESSAEAYYTIIAARGKPPLQEGVYRWAAEFYLNDGRNERSLEILRMLEKTYPDAGHGETYYMMGENYRRTGKSEEAVEYFGRAVKAGVPSPQKERCYLGMGRAYFDLGDNAKALVALETALAEHADNTTGALARFEIGNIKSRKKEFGEAAKQYMMVAILYDDPEISPKALFEAGTAFKRGGMPEKARKAFEELMEKYPDNELAAKAAEEVKEIDVRAE